MAYVLLLDGQIVQRHVGYDLHANHKGVQAAKLLLRQLAKGMLACQFKPLFTTAELEVGQLWPCMWSLMQGS